MYFANPIVTHVTEQPGYKLFTLITNSARDTQSELFPLSFY